MCFPETSADPYVVVDACLPKGFNESFVSPEDGKEYLIVPAEGGADFDECDKQVGAAFGVCSRKALTQFIPQEHESPPPFP